MKKSILVSLVATLLLPILAIGCKPAESSNKVIPVNNQTQKIEITMDDFAAQNNVTKDIELKVNDKLTVSLGSNPSTGYAWGDAQIGNAAVVAQDSHNYIEPSSNALGAPGKDVWGFTAKTAGTTTIKISYSRSWEGGEKGTWTLTINITVK